MRKLITALVVLVIAVSLALLLAPPAKAADVNTYAPTCKSINPYARVINVGHKFSGGTAQVKVCLLKTSKFNVVLGAMVHSTVKTSKRYDLHGKFLTPMYKAEDRGTSYLALNTRANRWVVNHRYFYLAGYRPSYLRMGIVIRYTDGDLYALDRYRYLT
jgi:hypothetical protein